MATQKRRESSDMVKEQGKLVGQVYKERTSAMEWETKWGFLKNRNKMLEDEALRRGWTRDDYWDAVRAVNIKPIIKHQTDVDIKSENFPKRSSEFIGWRHRTVLEKKEKPLIPPLEKKPSQNVIFLG